jgi:hypothetical protein
VHRTVASDRSTIVRYAKTVLHSAEDHRRFGASPADVDRQQAALRLAYGYPEDLGGTQPGGDVEYPELRLDEEASRWTLLLQLEGTPDMDWSAGALYWMIRHDERHRRVCRQRRFCDRPRSRRSRQALK